MGAMSRISTLALTSVLSLTGLASAGFDASSKSNVAVYWGQSSIGENEGVQQPLATYCDDKDINIIPLAFLLQMEDKMELEFSVTGAGCGDLGNGLFDCKDTIGKDIAECQAKGKTILLSIGGDAYKGNGFSTDEKAKEAAKRIWGTFGPKDPAADYPRPFGDVAVDGFDYDFEKPVGKMDIFGKELRKLMNTDTSKKYYLSAAPQCPFPEQNYKEALEQVDFDFVMVQYYNNECGIQAYVPGQETKFNFQEWDKWAKSSKNPDAKVMLGIPAAKKAAGSGYTEGEQLTSAIEDLKKYDSFGGVMMWDMSQLYGNTGFLKEVVGALGTVPTGTGPAAPGNGRQNEEDDDDDDEELPGGDLGNLAVNNAIVADTTIASGDKPKETDLTPPPAGAGGVFMETGLNGSEGGDGDGDNDVPNTNNFQANSETIPKTEEKEVAGSRQQEGGQGANGWPTDGSYAPPAGVDDGKYREEFHKRSVDSEVVARRWVA